MPLILNLFSKDVSSTKIERITETSKGFKINQLDLFISFNDILYVYLQK